MLMKPFFAMPFLLALLAMSATAHAGSTITDKSYWPGAARPAVHGAASSVQSGPRDAFASSKDAPRFEVAPMVDGGGNAWRYHGGPKSPL